MRLRAREISCGSLANAKIIHDQLCKMGIKKRDCSRVTFQIVYFQVHLELFYLFQMSLYACMLQGNRDKRKPCFVGTQKSGEDILISFTNESQNITLNLQNCCDHLLGWQTYAHADTVSDKIT